MPDKWPLANGNWSNAANWNGGTKPVAGDDVYADGRTVTVDEDFSVATIRNTQRSGGTAGGSFSFSSGRNCTCDIITGSTTCVTSISGSVTINGNITGGTGTPAAGISVTNNGTVLTINGNVTGGSGTLSGSNNSSGILMSLSSAGAPSTLNVNGNVTSGGGTGGYGIWLQSTAGALPTAIITGTVSCGPGTNSIRFERGTLTVNGNVTATSNQAAIYNSGQTFVSLVVNGNVSGGSGTNTRGILMDVSPTGAITINGNVIAGSGSNCQGFILSSGTSNCTVSIVEAIASTTSGAVSNSSPSSIVQIKKLTSASNGLFAVSGFFRFTNDPDISMYHWRGDTTFVTLTDVTQVAGLLTSVANVRQGTSYNAGGLTGTLAVPNPNQVAVGVSTDNTVGTAVITESSLRAAMGLASANLDTQLAGIATDIDNITVDNAAIATAVESQLTDNFQAVLDAVGNIEVDNAAIAQAVETQLADDFQEVVDAIGDVDVTVIAAPISAEDVERVLGSTIRAFTGETGTVSVTIRDSNQALIDLTGKTLRMVFSINENVVHRIVHDDLDVAGSVVTFSKSLSITGGPGEVDWSLFEVGKDALAHGVMYVKKIPY